MNNTVVAIDARRKINSGIGRVSQWLALNAPELIGTCRPVYITSNSGQHGYEFGESEIVETNIQPFSFEEAYRLPELVASTGASLYINPQTTWSPFHCVKSVNIIHDLWAITNPEWLPTEGDLKSRFDIDNIGYFDTLSRWFTKRKRSELLTQKGVELFSQLCDQSNPISLGVWAQYAATVEYSATLITVSNFVRELLMQIFPRGQEAIVIPNVPKDFLRGIRQQPSPQSFLVLSKLERRKNLDFLLDAYEDYCNTVVGTPHPLIIAGDPGYRSVATALHNRVTRLVQQGFDIQLKPSVSDSELSKLFLNAIALVFPTHFEGFGLPPLEAMLAGVPVIATRTGMLAGELSKHTVIIDPLDKTSLVNALHGARKAGKDLRQLEEARRDVLQFGQTVNSTELWRATVRCALKE